MGSLEAVHIFLILLAFWLVPLAQTRLQATPIMPLSEVQPGMRGYWKTVVSGTEIRTFELEILGVMPGMAGPQQPVIIALSPDPEHILTGTVAGMSGSPVFIDGKLIGAYAYGWLWPKEQALIGITPIENMLEILQFPEEMELAPLRPPTWNRATDVDGRRLEPLPAPLFVSGFSPTTIRHFRSQWLEWGIDLQEGLGSGAGEPEHLIDWRPEPGAAVAAVLAAGDFSAAATGTVTWVEGDRLLGFGHPFMGVGALDIPMAGADIMTIVQSLRLSFKMSRTGPIIGTVTQDRLTGIQGDMSRIPAMTEVVVRTQPLSGTARTFRSQLWRHPQVMPVLASMAMLDGGLLTLEGEDRQTFRLSTRIELAGRDAIELRQVGSGPTGMLALIVETQNVLMRLMDNAFEPVVIERIEFDVATEYAWRLSTLRHVRLMDGRPRAGADLDISLRIDGLREATQFPVVSIPIPASLAAGDTVVVQIADGQTLNAADGAVGVAPVSVEDLVRRINMLRPQDSIYVRLLRPSAGARFDGLEFPGLPASVRAQIAQPDLHVPRQTLNEIVLWETRIPVSGEFRGTYRIPLILQ